MRKVSQYNLDSEGCICPNWLHKVDKMTAPTDGHNTTGQFDPTIHNPHGQRKACSIDLRWTF